MATPVLSPPLKPKEKEQFSTPPPLINGDHLTRAEFHRRNLAQPHIKKAELIEGVVYMPSPVQLVKHSKPHSRIILFLGNYVVATPGTDFGDNATLILDNENQAQPDAFLRIHESFGGQSKGNEKDYLRGVPKLIVEVAASSAGYDLHEKLRAYRRNGVQEYLVLLAYEQETRWFQLVEGAYELMPADDEGVICSQVFPGLHFHPQSFWADDLAGLLKILQKGLASTEHQAFIAMLKTTQTG